MRMKSSALGAVHGKYEALIIMCCRKWGHMHSKTSDSLGLGQLPNSELRIRLQAKRSYLVLSPDREDLYDLTSRAKRHRLGC